MEGGAFYITSLGSLSVTTSSLKKNIAVSASVAEYLDSPNENLIEDCEISGNPLIKMDDLKEELKVGRC